MAGDLEVQQPSQVTLQSYALHPILKSPHPYSNLRTVFVPWRSKRQLRRR